MTFRVHRHWLGLSPYASALEQQQIWEMRVKSSSLGQVLGCEHPNVITIGARADAAKELQDPIIAESTPVVRADRGGYATFHAPGQLVIYPILPLRRWGMGARAHVDLLLSATQKLCQNHGRTGFTIASRPGVYTERGKIAFVGVRIRNGVSSHGIAINVRNDMGLFVAIRSCGRTGETFDRLAGEAPLKDLFDEWVQIFSEKLVH
jgi:lipoyl(octanoyl) transferase